MACLIDFFYRIEGHVGNADELEIFRAEHAHFETLTYRPVFLTALYIQN